MTRVYHNKLPNFEKTFLNGLTSFQIHIQQSQYILWPRIIRSNCEKDLFCGAGRTWKAFSRKAAGREDFFYIWGSWGLTRTGLALVDRPSRANRASFLLLAHHRVVSCQGQGSSLEPDLFPTGATGPATWDIPDDLGPHGQFARSIPSQMGPYRRLINHQVTRPLLYGHGIHCSSTISLFGDRESAPSFYSPRLGSCFEAILVVYPPLASFYRWKFRVEEEIHVKKSVKRRLEFASIDRIFKFCGLSGLKWIDVSKFVIFFFIVFCCELGSSKLLNDESFERFYFDWMCNFGKHFYEKVNRREFIFVL